MLADDHDRVDHDFTLHPPVWQATAANMDALRDKFRTLAHDIIDACPSSRERSTALTRLEESMFHAIASLARNQPAEDAPDGG